MGLQRWHTGTKGQTLQFLREAGCSLKGVSDNMSAVEKEDGVTDWDVCFLKCRICGYGHPAVIPSEAEPEDQECPNCRNMTADILEVATK